MDESRSEVVISSTTRVFVLWERVLAKEEKWNDNFREVCPVRHSSTSYTGSTSTATAFLYSRHHPRLPVLSRVFDTMERRHTTKKENKKGIHHHHHHHHQVHYDYSLFRVGIRPDWEDPCNAKGGRLFVRSYLTEVALDSCWETLVKLLMEGTLGSGGERSQGSYNDSFINGIRAVDKSKRFPIYVLEIWLSTTIIEQEVMEQIRTSILKALEGCIPSEHKNKKRLVLQWYDHKCSSNNQSPPLPLVAVQPLLPEERACTMESTAAATTTTTTTTTKVIPVGLRPGARLYR